MRRRPISSLYVSNLVLYKYVLVGTHTTGNVYDHTCDSPVTTAAVAFVHFVSAGTTPGAEGADLEGSCRTVQAEEAGPQEGWRK